VFKQRVVFVCLAAALAAGVAAIASTSSPAAAEKIVAFPRYGFEVILAPAGIPGSYRMEAAVRDLDGGKIVAMPRIILSAGKPGRVEEAVEGRDHRAVVDVQITEDQQTAEIVFQVVADHRSITFARTTITLPGP
jgi:hypothetical protein